MCILYIITMFQFVKFESTHPRGTPQIEVTFDIDANGIVNVSAKDKGTGKEQKIQIQASGGLSDEEINKMVKDAEANKEADKKKRESVDARNQADSLVFSTEKSLKEHGGKISAEEKKGRQDRDFQRRCMNIDSRLVHQPATKPHDGLVTALSELGQLERAAQGLAPFTNMVLAAQFVAFSALQRTESRGGHYRLDFAHTRDLGARSQFTLSDVRAGLTDLPEHAVKGWDYFSTSANTVASILFIAYVLLFTYC